MRILKRMLDFIASRMLMVTEVPQRNEFIHEHAQDALLDV